MKQKITYLSLILATAMLSCKDQTPTAPCQPGEGGGTEEKANFGVYYPGDFHQHTTYTDGSASMGYVMQRNYDFGLAWWANSEHGGSFDLDGSVSGYDLGSNTKWDPAQIKNNPTLTGTKMWRWQSIEEESFVDVLAARKKFPNKLIIQGLEWNPPGHEHASMAIITDAFGANASAKYVAEFEYRFDNNDKDMVGKAGWLKSTKTGHEKTIEALKWLQTNHGKTSWVVPAHPERQNKYQISDFRDMNNAAPDVCFGFESAAGHQSSSDRGGIGASSSYKKSGTFGGVSIMAAQVGGLWDAMLSEGRNWWLFASSDFHTGASTQNGGDFYPGEYQKTYAGLKSGFTPQSLVDGLRSGNSFIVHGDLIDALQFSIGNATMGQTYDAKSGELTVKIMLRDPEGQNHNVYSSYNTPDLDHFDLIMGDMTGKVDPSSPNYTKDEVATTKIIARFDAKGGAQDNSGLKSIAWKDMGGGYRMVEYKVSGVTSDKYFRLRGTNHKLGSAELDGAGNPAADKLGANTAAIAFDDLWFYSNPVFVKAKK